MRTRLHLLVRRGDAEARTLVAFGGIERHKEELRDGRGLAWLGGMRLGTTRVPDRSRVSRRIGRTPD
jgi:hypothetical protein